MGQQTHSMMGRDDATSATAHWDTPPMDVISLKAGLLACGSPPTSVFPGRTQWHAGRKLTTYSCGGSAGISARSGSPTSLLAPARRRRRPENL